MDAFAQMQTFSGDRGKEHCVLFTCSSGSIIAVSPGPNISCPPRGGDGLSLGVQLGLAEENEMLTGVPSWCSRLFDGTEELGVGWLLTGDMSTSPMSFAV